MLRRAKRIQSVVAIGGDVKQYKPGNTVLLLALSSIRYTSLWRAAFRYSESINSRSIWNASRITFNTKGVHASEETRYNTKCLSLRTLWHPTETQTAYLPKHGPSNQGKYTDWECPTTGCWRQCLDLKVGAQIPCTRSPRRPDFGRRRPLFVRPQYGTCAMSFFLCLESWGSYIFGKFMHLSEGRR
jgi:hypothetical protein